MQILPVFLVLWMSFSYHQVYYLNESEDAETLWVHSKSIHFEENIIYYAKENYFIFSPIFAYVV